MKHSAITDTGYAEQVLRKAKEFAQEIRSIATERSEGFAASVEAIGEAVVKDRREQPK